MERNINKQQRQKIINDNKRNYLITTKKYVDNAVILNTHNTIEHELKKCETAYELIYSGHTILTEAELKNGSRPDIIVMDVEPPMVFEILASEKEANILLKEDKYGLKIIKVKAYDEK